MKNFLMLLTLVIGLCFQAFPKENVLMEINRKGQGKDSTTVRRSPMRSLVEVYYDDEMRQVEVVGDEDIEVQIYLFDGNENIVGYETSLNCVMDLPENCYGPLTIKIESENWISTGIISL